MSAAKHECSPGYGGGDKVFDSPIPACLLSLFPSVPLSGVEGHAMSKGKHRRCHSTAECWVTGIKQDPWDARETTRPMARRLRTQTLSSRRTNKTGLNGTT